MSVFTPDSNIVKETINVNYSDRRTAQKVIFINRENEYYGTTKGKLDTNGGIVKNATLSACNVVDRSGNRVDLGEIVTKLDDVSAAVDQRISSVYGQVDFLSGAIDTVSGDVDKLKQMSAGNLTLVGELSVLGCTTFKNIFTANGYGQEDVIKNGYMYMLRTEQDAVVENVNITDKDFIITKTDELSVKVKDLNAGKFMFIDAMDKSLVQRVSVLELSAVESDSKIATLDSKFSTLNGRVDELSTKVDGFVDQRARIDTISTDLNALEAKQASDMGMAWEQIGRVRDIADHVREDMDELSQDLDSEISTRADEDADIRANLKLSVDNLLSGQGGDVSALTTKLNKEINDRISGDDALNDRIDDLTAFVVENYATKEELNEVDGKFADYTTTSVLTATYLTKDDASNTYATKTELDDEISAEREARIAKDDELEEKIGGGYGELTALVDAERERAISSENELSSDLTALRDYVDTNVESINERIGDLTALVTTTYATKKELADEISSEREARIAKDDELSAKIGGGYGELTALVDAERIRAEGVESTLSGRIDNALTAIASVQESVETETERAEGVEDFLSGKIDDALSAISNEKTRAENAESSLRSDLDDTLTSILSINTKIDDEISRAIEAEEGIAEDVQTISVDLATTKKTLIGSIDYKGHVRTDKYGTEKVDLSTVFHDYLSLDVGQSYTFKNGWIYWFTNDAGVYETKDGLRIKDKDYVLVHSHTDVSVDISNVGPSVVDIISYNGNNIITKEDLDRTVAQIDKRIDDAITAIEDLDTKLTEEITRAGQAEAGLGTRIDDAFTAINDEKTRAQGAESSLRSDLDDALTSILSVNTKIDEEEDRATGVEDVLSGKIDDALTEISSEKTRAEGVEDFLSGKIDEALSAISDEKTRAESIEGALDSKIDGVYEDLLTAVSDLQDKIDEETASRRESDDVITSMVDAETTRAISCEGILSGRIDANDILIESVGNETKKKVVLNREFDALSGKFKTVENIESLQVVQLSTISEYADVSSTVGILSNAIYFVEEDPMVEYQQAVARDAGISYEYLKNNLTTGITVEQMITSLLPVLSSLANMK